MQPISDNLRGAAYMTLGMGGFIVNDTLMKAVSADMGMFQAVFLRGVFALLLIGAFAWRAGALFYRFPSGGRKLLALRVVGEIGGTVCFLTALFNMPIANATAILQMLPLAIALGASVFLREPVGWRRYLAIGLGFLGVLIIIRPGTDGFQAHSIWALAAVMFLVLRDLATRRFPADVPSVFVSLTTAVAITMVGGLLSMTEVWAAVAPATLTLLAAAAVFLFVGYIFCVMGMRVGEIGFVSPFRYSILIWAIPLGYFVFGDTPDRWMIAGSAIVVATGLYTLYRERVAARRPSDQEAIAEASSTA